MKNVNFYPFQFEPNPYGTNIKFVGEEDKLWVVEIDTDSAEKYSRLRFTFHGAPRARINDPYDTSELPKKWIVTKLVESPWLKEFFDAYVKKHGEGMLPAVDDMLHFVVHGHDLTLGFLARSVQMEPIGSSNKK